MPLRPINRRPDGFLDFFGLKSLGRNPEAFTDDVQLGVDLREWYLATNSENVRGVSEWNNAALVGSRTFEAFNAVPLVVPQNEWWFVHAATCITVVMAGGAITLPGLSSQASALPGGYLEQMVNPQNSIGAFGATLTLSRGEQLRRWLRPGTVLGVSFHFMDPSGLAPGDLIRVQGHYSITRAGR